MKNQYTEEDCLERGLGQFADLRGGVGGLARERGVILREVDTPMHTMHCRLYSAQTRAYSKK